MWPRSLKGAPLKDVFNEFFWIGLQIKGKLTEQSVSLRFREEFSEIWNYCGMVVNSVDLKTIQYA